MTHGSLSSPGPVKIRRVKTMDQVLGEQRNHLLCLAQEKETLILAKKHERGVIDEQIENLTIEAEALRKAATLISAPTSRELDRFNGTDAEAAQAIRERVFGRKDD